MTTPLPQRVTVQLLSQPSPLIALPSSQPSPAVTMPLPQAGRLAVVVAAVAVDAVAVVALLAGVVERAVAAQCERAVGVTGRRLVRAVSHCSPAVDDAVAAARQGAVVVAAVAVDAVAVVAGLAGRDDAVAAAGQPAVGVAAVAVDRVAVVALLAGRRVGPPVAALHAAVQSPSQVAVSTGRVALPRRPWC